MYARVYYYYYYFQISFEVLGEWGPVKVNLKFTPKRIRRDLRDECA